MVQDLYTTEFSMGMVQDMHSTILMQNTLNMGMVSIHYALVVSMGNGTVQVKSNMGMVQKWYSNGTEFVQILYHSWAKYKLYTVQNLYHYYTIPVPSLYYCTIPVPYPC